jgi:hypothetical protein
MSMIKMACFLLHKVILFPYLSDGFFFFFRCGITTLLGWQAFKGSW